MATVKSIDCNCISRNGVACGGRLVAITIDQIVTVWKDGNNVTTIKVADKDDVHTSNTPVIYKVSESLDGIAVKANAADSNNGLVMVTVTKVAGTTLATPKLEIINRTKIISMVPIDGGGTRIKYGHWFRSIMEIQEDLVTETASASS